MWAGLPAAPAADVLVELGADLKRNRRPASPAIVRPKFIHRDGQSVSTRGQRQRRRARPHERLNMAVERVASSSPPGSTRRGPNAADPGALGFPRWPSLRKPGADGAAVGTRPPPPTGNLSAIQLAKKLLERGANPNVRIKWEERPFGKEGGTMRNPPLIQLGRHYLTYNGATPFYIAAHNGDVEYMRLLAQHGADANIRNALNITPLIVASGLDYWEGETHGPFTGVSEAERIEAIKLTLDDQNDVNDHADFGDAAGVEGDPGTKQLSDYP
jgi:ankyrin repeat protein